MQPLASIIIQQLALETPSGKFVEMFQIWTGWLHGKVADRDIVGRNCDVWIIPALLCTMRYINHRFMCFGDEALEVKRVCCGRSNTVNSINRNFQNLYLISILTVFSVSKPFVTLMRVRGYIATTMVQEPFVGRQLDVQYRW